MRFVLSERPFERSIRLRRFRHRHLADWIHLMSGPPPGEILGGVTALDPGQTATFTADFTPCEYALLCPIPSPKDGEAHTYKGMMRQFTVQ